MRIPLKFPQLIIPFNPPSPPFNALNQKSSLNLPLQSPKLKIPLKCLGTLLPGDFGRVSWNSQLGTHMMPRDARYSDTDKSYRSLINSNWNQIIFIIFRLIWKQTDVPLVPKQSDNGKYNLISVRFNKISKISHNIPKKVHFRPILLTMYKPCNYLNLSGNARKILLSST